MTVARRPAIARLRLLLIGVAGLLAVTGPGLPAEAAEASEAAAETAWTGDQQMLTLSVIAYRRQGQLAGKVDGELKLHRIVSKTLSEEQPTADWDLIWGPSVFMPPGSRAAPTMAYVVRSRRWPSRLTVVVRGTVLTSIEQARRRVLDLQLVEWPTRRKLNPDEGNPRISRGARMALEELLTLRPCAPKSPEREPAQRKKCLDTVPGADLTLAQLLAQIDDESRRPLDVRFAGHSFGGSVATLAALWFHERRGDSILRSVPAWDPRGRNLTRAWTVGSQTAGDRAFAAYADLELSGRHRRVVSPLDVVPRWWSASGLSSLETLYADCEDRPTDHPLVRWIANSLLDSVGDSDYAHLPGGYKEIVDPCGGVGKLWLCRMLDHHVDAYVKAFELDGVIEWRYAK